MAESVLSFFTKLVENSPQLILLFLGTALFVISGAEQLPIGNAQVPLSSSVRIGLFLIGLLLIAFALWMLYGNEKFRRVERIDDLEKKSKDLAEKVKVLEDLINRKDARISELETSVEKALEVSQEKGFGEVYVVLSKTAQVLTQSEDKFKILLDAANWVDIKINKWINLINAADYQEYGISNNNIGEFRNEISAHLDLLKSNLREMIPDTIPRLCNIPQTVAKNSLAYAKALKYVKSQMEIDLKKDQEISITASEQLLAYMKILIEKTTA